MKKIIFTLLFTGSLLTCKAQIEDFSRPMAGISVSYGFGTHYFDTRLLTNDGEQVKLSAGGGTGFGILFHAPVRADMLIGCEFIYQNTIPRPVTEDVNASFTRSLLLFPVNKIFLMPNNKWAVLAGAGPMFIFSPRLDLNGEGKNVSDSYYLNGLIIAHYSYKNTIAPFAEVKAMFMTKNKKWGGTLGIRYSFINYRIDEIDGSNVKDEDDLFYVPDEILNPNGSGIDVTMTSILYFGR